MPRRLLVAALSLAVLILAPQVRAEDRQSLNVRPPCQMIQLRQWSDSWSAPLELEVAEKRIRTDQRWRPVPEGSTRIYRDRHVRPLIVCLVKVFPVAGGLSKALSVAECESGLGVWAENGPYKGIFQMHAGRFRDNAPPGGGSIWNAWSHVYAALRSAMSGWGGWACA